MPRRAGRPSLAHRPWSSITMASLWLFCGCGPTAKIQPRDASPLHEGPAELLGLRLTCAPDAGRWSLRVQTGAWSGAGLLLWGDREDRLESHSFLSTSAAADGSSDCLSLGLSVAADPREANPGSSTRFGCEAIDRLSARVFVADTQAEVYTDCRAWGPDPAVFSGREGLPACDRPLDGALDLDGDTATFEVSLSEGSLGDCG